MLSSPPINVDSALIGRDPVLFVGLVLVGRSVTDPLIH